MIGHEGEWDLVSCERDPRELTHPHLPWCGREKVLSLNQASGPYQTPMVSLLWLGFLASSRLSWKRLCFSRAPCNLLQQLAPQDCAELDISTALGWRQPPNSQSPVSKGGWEGASVMVWDTAEEEEETRAGTLLHWAFSIQNCELN